MSKISVEGFIRKQGREEKLMMKKSGLLIGSNLNKEKRRLGESDRHILYRKANRKCENCGKRLNYESEMQIGHKKAYSKSGKTKLANSVCLCYPCNREQSTDSWEIFRRKQNKPIVPTSMSHLERKRQPFNNKNKKKTKKKQENNFFGY